MPIHPLGFCVLESLQGGTIRFQVVQSNVQSEVTLGKKRGRCLLFLIKSRKLFPSVAGPLHQVAMTTSCHQSCGKHSGGMRPSDASTPRSVVPQAYTSTVLSLRNGHAEQFSWVPVLHDTALQLLAWPLLPLWLQMPHPMRPAAVPVSVSGVGDGVWTHQRRTCPWLGQRQWLLLLLVVLRGTWVIALRGPPGTEVPTA